MIDIVEVTHDLIVYDTNIPKASNILKTQVGSLTFAPDFGIDLKYFLTENLRFQNESFKAYIIQVLANHGINANAIIDDVEALYSKYTITVNPENNTTSLVAR